MAKKALPSPEVLRQLVRYEPDTGDLFWNVRSQIWFHPTGKTDDRISVDAWNLKFAGKRAFSTATRKGYLRGAICGTGIFAHRVAFAIYYQRWPTTTIDHINGVKSDNRIANLRDVPMQENARNMPLTTRNSSGAIGVMRETNYEKWLASIRVSGKLLRVGLFHDINDAIAARKAAEMQYGFHENHGRPMDGGGK